MIDRECKIPYHLAIGHNPSRMDYQPLNRAVEDLPGLRRVFCF